ncbi:rhodanese-like domain-containing protein [Desulfolutivibrio sulfoxidireducens]|uniref:rhodanese-like domain-containing protein n=1 Tax=Desulfolutivibrio sulfoxidireducens TaxID=2773299 RepID=UPI00159E267E|nr:rhodanese-like domain-containing protein [Desulfolutivibrio sulfoxidireducens]QLA15385.1 rhodanese [Desulfolutivibrio sulfoxidireducens]QLA18982.1 rhodanese [Desulfolutivibrio sulfoxidireducens]
MNRVRRTVVQSGYIIVMAVLCGLMANLLRPGGLPVVQATESAVTLPADSANIALKDAVVLSLSKRAVFLDARSGFEFADGHIQGAVSVPVDDFERIFPGIEKDLAGKDAIITYCDGEHCPLSGELAEKLTSRGVKNVFVLKNGWTLWNNEGLPVEKGQRLESLLGVRDNLRVACAK